MTEPHFAHTAQHRACQEGGGGNSHWQQAVLILVLGLSAFQIFYNLGVPSLWLDEAAAPMHARYPVSYMLQLSSKLEEHPPLFYLGSKLFMLLGDSDFRIRLFPALCGLGCTIMIYLTGRRMSGAAGGLMAMSLWVASPHILWLSRIARPYIFFLLLVLVSFRVLLACLENRSAWRIGGLLLVNAVMILTHYVGAFVICAQITSLVCYRLMRRRRVVDWSMAVLCAGSLLTAGSVYALLIRTSMTPDVIMAGSPSMGMVLDSFGRNIADSMTYFAFPTIGAGILLLSCVSMILGSGAGRHGPVLLINTFGAAFLLFALQKTSGLYPRHFSYMVIFVCLGLAQGAVKIFPSRRACAMLALVVAVAGVGSNMTVWRKAFYEEGSYQIPVIGDNYKALAREAAARLLPGEIINFSNPFYGNVISFYLDRMAAACQANPDAPSACGRPGCVLASRMRLEPKDEYVRLALFMNIHPGYFAATPMEFEKLYGPLDALERIDRSSLFRMSVRRTPLHVLEPAPAFFRAPMDYSGFYRNVTEARDIAYSLNARGPAVMASINDADSYAGYIFENNVGDGAQTIFVQMEFDNTGEGNSLWLEYAFDDEPARRIPVSRGYDVSHQALEVIKRETGYKRLSLRAVLRCSSLEPSLDGANLATLRFKGLSCMACPSGTEKQCQEAAQAGLEQSRLLNYISEDFPNLSRVRQSVAAANTNVVTAREGDRPDWALFVPANRDEPAELRLRVLLDKDRLSFFPRLGNNSWVKLEKMAPSGDAVTLFSLANATDSWTPVGGRYEITIPPELRGAEQELVITFGGKWAQLWHLNNAVFF
jgi:hypothetical protein